MCVCSIGFYRNHVGACVPLEECLYVGECGPNEYHNECGNPCQETKCNHDPNDSRICAEGKDLCLNRLVA